MINLAQYFDNALTLLWCAVALGVIVFGIHYAYDAWVVAARERRTWKQERRRYFPWSLDNRDRK